MILIDQTLEQNYITVSNIADRIVVYSPFTKESFETDLDENLSQHTNRYSKYLFVQNLDLGTYNYQLFNNDKQVEEGILKVVGEVQNIEALASSQNEFKVFKYEQ